MKKTLAVLICVSFLLPLYSAKSGQKPISVAFGKVATVASGTFIFPDFLSSEEGKGFESEKPFDIPGLELAMPAGFSLKDGDTILCVGQISGACMDVSYVFSNAIKWADGVYKSNKLDSDGFIIDIESPNSAFYILQGKFTQSDMLFEKRVDLFGRLSKTGIDPVLVVASKSALSRFTVKLTGKQETQTITTIAIKDWGKIQEKISILAQTHPNTLFMDGPSMSNFDLIGLGRLGAIEGAFDTQTGIMATDVVLSDLYASTFGGRLFGCISGIGGDSFKLRVCLPGPITENFNIKHDPSTKFLLKGKLTDFKTLANLALNNFIPCEVIGGLINDQFTIFARLVRMYPNDISRYFCGMVRGVEVVDLLGQKKAIKIDDEVKVIYGQGTIEDGKLIEAWFEGDKVVGIAFPTVGILGVPLEGVIEKISNGVLYFKCHRSYDYNLFGRNLTLKLFDKCKLIVGGVGEVNQENVEPGTSAVCYGFFDGEEFIISLINLLI